MIILVGLIPSLLRAGYTDNFDPEKCASDIEYVCFSDDPRFDRSVTFTREDNEMVEALRIAPSYFIDQKKLGFEIPTSLDYSKVVISNNTHQISVDIDVEKGEITQINIPDCSRIKVFTSDEVCKSYYEALALRRVKKFYIMKAILLQDSFQDLPFGRVLVRNSITKPELRVFEGKLFVDSPDCRKSNVNKGKTIEACVKKNLRRASVLYKKSSETYRTCLETMDLPKSKVCKDVVRVWNEFWVFEKPEPTGESEPSWIYSLWQENPKCSYFYAHILDSVPTPPPKAEEAETVKSDSVVTREDVKPLCGVLTKDKGSFDLLLKDRDQLCSSSQRDSEEYCYWSPDDIDEIKKGLTGSGEKNPDLARLCQDFAVAGFREYDDNMDEVQQNARDLFGDDIEFDSDKCQISLGGVSWTPPIEGAALMMSYGIDFNDYQYDHTPTRSDYFPKEWFSGHKEDWDREHWDTLGRLSMNCQSKKILLGEHL